MLCLDICWFVLICYYHLCVTEVHAIFTHHSSKVGIVFTLCVCMSYASRCLYVCLSTRKGSGMHLISKWRPSLIMIWEVTCYERCDPSALWTLVFYHFITLRWSLLQHFGVHCTPVFLLPEFLYTWEKLKGVSDALVKTVQRLHMFFSIWSSLLG